MRALFMLALLWNKTVHAQINDVFVDKQGAMRWSINKKEVYGFGVNYTAPFAHVFRSAKKLNVNLERAIDDDVYHFARLGFDAFRVHVWDTEITDSTGTLLDNEQLHLFDYLVLKLKERGIKIFITPIAFWGNGWPEPDEKTPGFSYKYGKDACLTNEDAIRAQEKYLFQFLNHVNPYTKTAYKNDPDIVGFEISNEPHHRGSPGEVTSLINRLAASMRRTGCGKPIFYNVSHSIHLQEAYFKSNINGGTFQWYPTGLGAGHELRGNFLPNVDQYIIPFANDPKFKAAGKIVYEFDAADIGRSYIYPAMARSFREAGIQWATHFAYDPTFMAGSNTEYTTHYMNLVYAPQKAISLKIAGEVFHRMPRYKSYGRYPDNTSFDAFRVSYTDDLAEMVTGNRYFYTNTTTTTPPKPALLEEICGYGNSTVVRYEGYGAYFLDKIEPGVWRLEVMPDAVWVNDPFGKNSLQKKVAVINRREWTMSLRIPDIGQEFSVSPLNEGKHTEQTNGTFSVMPGTYLIVKKGTRTNVNADSRWKNIRIGEFAAPQDTLSESYVLHTPVHGLPAGYSVKISASVITPQPADTVILQAGTAWGHYVPISMNRVAGYEYEAVVPSEMLQPGYFQYYISVSIRNRTVTFPCNVEGIPNQWDFTGTKPYKVPVYENKDRVYLFEAGTDADNFSTEVNKSFTVIPEGKSNDVSLKIETAKLATPDPENICVAPTAHYAMRYNFGYKFLHKPDQVPAFTKLVFRGETLGSGFPLEVSLVDKEGYAFGGKIMLDGTTGLYALDLVALKPAQQVLLPRPFPTFLPYYTVARGNKVLDITKAESLQLSIVDGVPGEARKFKIYQIWLE